MSKIYQVSYLNGWNNTWAYYKFIRSLSFVIPKTLHNYNYILFFYLYNKPPCCCRDVDRTRIFPALPNRSYKDDRRDTGKKSRSKLWNQVFTCNQRVIINFKQILNEQSTWKWPWFRKLREVSAELMSRRLQPELFCPLLSRSRSFSEKVFYLFNSRLGAGAWAPGFIFFF